VNSVSLTFRHIIDDGAIFYLNGVEFHRFNMPNDPITYVTQAPTAIGDGNYSGPYTTNITVNIPPGDNVIACEVHQSGTASSDISFGAEISVTGLSVGSSTPQPPVLAIAKQGTNVVVSWSGKGTLEKKNRLLPTTLWSPVTDTNPYTAAPRTSTNQATFYRVRQK